MKDVFDVSDLDNTCTQETCENWDSLHHLMLISELEDAFGVEFDPEEMAEMKTFAQVKSTSRAKCKRSIGNVCAHFVDGGGWQNDMESVKKCEIG